jgi:hypothetical protein
MTKIFKKFHLGKLASFWSKIAIYLSLSLHKGRPSYRTFKRENPALPNMKFLHFFLFFWGNFCPTGIRIQPTKINADPKLVVVGPDPDLFGQVSVLSIRTWGIWK